MHDALGVGFFSYPTAWTRVRGNAHDSKGADAGSDEGRYQSAESIHWGPVRVSLLNCNHICIPMHLLIVPLDFMQQNREV